MRKKLILLVFALAAVAMASVIPPAAATTCPPNTISIDCGGGITICCYKFQSCICPAPLD